MATSRYSMDTIRMHQFKAFDGISITELSEGMFEVVVHYNGDQKIFAMSKEGLVKYGLDLYDARREYIDQQALVTGKPTWPHHLSYDVINGVSAAIAEIQKLANVVYLPNGDYERQATEVEE